MEQNTKQRWLDICAEAIVCEDPQRFAELIAEINAILRGKEERLSSVSRTETAA